MSIGSKPSGAGKNLSGSTGSAGPSKPKNPCAVAGAAKVAGGSTKCGNTGGAGAKPNLSGSKGNG